MRYAVPLIPEEVGNTNRAIQRVEKEAREGCPLSAAWLEDTAEQRALIERLRHTRLPPRAPDYEGPHLFGIGLKSLGKPPKSRGLPLRDPAELVAEHFAKARARDEQRRRGLSEGS